jgi:hypothetical protein
MSLTLDTYKKIVAIKELGETLFAHLPLAKKKKKRKPLTTQALEKG